MAEHFDDGLVPMPIDQHDAEDAECSGRPDHGDAEPQRKKRGPTRMKSLEEQKDLHIEFDPETYTPIGPRAANYANWVCSEVKHHISILYPDWKKVEKDAKDKLWQSIKVKYIRYIYFPGS